MRRLLTRAAVVAAAAALLWTVVVPALVATALRRSLAGAGLGPAELRVAALSPRRVVLADVSFGATLGVHRVAARWALPSFRLQDVVARGATLALPLAFDAGVAEPPQQQRDGTRRVLPDLPFARAAVQELSVVPPPGSFLGPVRVNAELRATAGGGAALQADAHAARLGLGLGLEAELRPGASAAAASGPIALEFASAASAPLALHGHACVAAAAGQRAFVFDVEGGGELELQGDAWPAVLQGLQATGSLRVHADADHGELVLDALSLRVPDSWRIDGIGGRVVWRTLAPLATPPAQVLRWRGTAAGRLEGGAGELRFQVLPGPVLAVERAHWRAGAEGTVTLGPFRVDAAAPELAARVTLHRVPLQDWLRLASQGRVTGEGLLSGSFEARVRFSPRLDVQLGEGRLQAEGGGSIRLLEDEATRSLVEQHAARIAAAAGQQDPEYERVVRERIVDSLRDFVFRELEFELVPAADDLGLRVHVAGRGRRVPQELDVNVNFHGFDALVDLALGLEQQAGRARERAADVLGGAAAGAEDGAGAERRNR